jgi:HTH-type transcriptional regulator / antitoxin HigA
MDIRPIRTESDLKDALLEIAVLMASEPAPGTPEGDRLDALVTLLQAYEARHFPIARPDAIEAISAFETGASVRRDQPADQEQRAPIRRSR